MPDDASAGLGHNQPPEPTAKEAAGLWWADVLATFGPRIDEMNEALAKASIIENPTKAHAEAATLAVKKARLLAADMEVAVKAGLAPSEQALAAYKAAPKETLERVGQVIAFLERFLADAMNRHGWSTVRSDYGPVASFRKVPDEIVIDPEALPRAYLVPDEARIKAALKEGVEIPGITRRPKAARVVVA